MIYYPRNYKEHGLHAGEYYPMHWLRKAFADLSASDWWWVKPKAIASRDIIVPDISFWDDDDETARKVDFEQMKKAGSPGVIVRAGQNLWVDEDFSDYWIAAKAAGLPRGAYWFYDPRVSPGSQADLFASLFAKDPPELGITLDAEYPISWGGAYAGWKYLYDFMERLKLKMPTAQKEIYTGYYWWYDNVWSKCTSAQLAYFKQFPLHLAWYIDDVSYVKIPQPWTQAEFRWWQYTDKGNGPLYGAESQSIDLNYFVPGGLDTFAKTFNLSGTSVPPAVEHTQPYAGVDEYIEIVNGQRCHITIIPMAAIKEIRVKHFNGALGYVSQSQAQIAFNGEDYDKKLPAPYKPYSLSIVGGVTYTPQRDFRKWLNIRQDKTLQFGHKDLLNPWMVTSFVRPLVLDGVINPTITDPAHAGDIENTEIHARAGFGYRWDGSLVQIVAEGHVVPETGIADRGVTLPQFAALFKKYGAFNAGEQGGGGDAGKLIAGKMVNTPSDPKERQVVQVIEIYLESTGEPPMTTTYTVKAKADATKIYKNADGTMQIASLNMADTAKADAIVGELIHITSKNGAALSGYVFLTKVTYTADTVTPPPPPPPVPTTPSVFITHDFTDTLTIDGKVYTAQFTVPDVEYKPQA